MYTNEIYDNIEIMEATNQLSDTKFNNFFDIS